MEAEVGYQSTSVVVLVVLVDVVVVVVVLPESTYLLLFSIDWFYKGQSSSISTRPHAKIHGRPWQFLRKLSRPLQAVFEASYIQSPNTSGTQNGGTHLYKLYVRLMQGKTHPQNSLIWFSTSILGT